MPCTEITTTASKVALFYDDLAPHYDHEQFQTAVALSKRTEWELFLTRLPELFAAADRVLEVGAGTGIFTIPIARHCHEITAMDLSRNMLAELQRKTHEAGLGNIRAVLGNVEQEAIPGTYSVICAFSCLEYMVDLPRLLQKLYNHLEPGGTLYFVTARRSFLRHFIQLGNAIRQKIWLKAYSHRELRRMLQDAGYGRIQISHHLFTVLGHGGMLLEVIARRAGGRDSHGDLRE